MKVYVDELPKDCKHCPCRQDVALEKEKLKWVECNIQDINKTHTENIDGHEIKVIDCPLELIADHDKEKDRRIAVLERAFDIATEAVVGNTVYCPTIEFQDDLTYEDKRELLQDVRKYCLNQAELELRNGDID